MANLKKPSTGPPPVRPSLDAPRSPGDPRAFAGFVERLNSELSRFDERLRKVPIIDEEKFVQDADLEKRVTDILDEQIATATSTNPATGTDTSRRRNVIIETAQAALENAIPTVAPPNVAAVSALGTTTEEPLFALADHTHGGVLSSGGAGTGVAGDVAYWTSAFEIGADNNFRWDATNHQFALGPASTAPVSLFTTVSTVAALDTIRLWQISAGSTDSSSILLARARGTTGAPSVPFTQNRLGAYAFGGWTQASTAVHGAEIRGIAAETWSATVNGTFMQFLTTVIGTTAMAEVARLTDRGSLAVGTTDDLAQLTVNADLAIKQKTVTVVNGSNNNLSVVDDGTGVQSSMVNLTGPSAAFTITGMVASTGISSLGASLLASGKLLFLSNNTTQVMTLANESASSTPDNRILTLTGADQTVAAAGVASLYYDRARQRWVVLGHNDTAGGVGPTGPAGAAGTAGPPGADGQDGEDYSTHPEAVATNVGTFGSTTQIPQFTVDIYGRVRTVTNVTPNSASTSGIDPFSYLAMAEWEGLQAAINTYGLGVTVLNVGTGVTSSDSTGMYCSLTTSATSANGIGWSFSVGGGIIDAQNLPRFSIRMKTGGDISSQRQWEGFTTIPLGVNGGAGTMNVDTPGSTSAASGAAFRYSTVAGDTNWQAVTFNGTSQTLTDTGIVVATNTRYQFVIDFSNYPTDVKFYINGTLVATNTGTLPASTTALGICSSLHTQVNATRNLKIARWNLVSQS